MPYRILALERQYASGGRAVGKAVADALGVPCYNREILEYAAERSGQTPEHLERLEETANTGLISSLQAAYARLARGERAALPPEGALLLAEAEVIRELADEGPCVLIGRSAGCILRDRTDVLRAFLYADEEARIRRAVDEYGHDENEAPTVLRYFDRRRANFYNANYRSADARIKFVCDGEEHTYKSALTFFGFRYIRLENWPDEVKKENFTAIVVHSDIRRTGYFECSDETVNKLFKNIIWGQKSNFLDVPTDCPQRNERLGWTGDAQVFVRTASLNFDVERFFKKWLRDLAADQGRDGCVPHVVPNIFDDMGGSSAWSDAAVICPWEIYRTYGDKKILEDQFDSMKAWIDWMRERSENGKRSGGFHFGDWLGLDSPEGSYKGSTPDDLIATAYYKYSTELFIKAAHALGRDVAEYENIPAEAAAAFRREYMENGRVKNATQTGCVFALCFDITDDRAATATQLNELVKCAGHLETGFVGTPYLLHALSDNGYAETAYDLLLRREYPSWLYPISKGATTVWEHWDGIKPDGTMCSTDMNSFNHYAYGAVADWMYGAAAGINSDPDRPGFEHIIFRPVTDRRLDFVKASIDTRRGTVASEWRRENGRIKYIFTVPGGCCASVIIGGEKHEVGAGTHEFFE